MSEIRFVTSADGTRIAYCVEGTGPPLLAIPFFIESFSLDHLIPEYVATLRQVSSGRQMIRYDTRGTGLSQRDVSDMSAPAMIADTEAVVDALNLERFDLWGASIGGARAAEFAAYHPGSVQRLLLFAAFASLTDVFSLEMLQGLAHLARSNWDLACRTLADLGTRRQSEEMGLRMSEWYRSSTTGDTLARFIESNLEHDLTPILSRIEMPTLIVHRTDDLVYPIKNAQKLASGVPNARLLAIPGVNNALFFESEEIVRAAQEFLQEGTPAESGGLQSAPSPANSAFRTVLFTDLVSHTEMMSRLGDERGRAVLREHERIAREVLKANGGTEVKTMGDGFMASFGSVTKAVECAIALQRAFADHEGEPLAVRVGLNAGEPIEEDGDLFGATVILASRIAAKAEGGEILVADTVRGLCSGKGFLFSDRGEFVAKGFEEPVRVYEVSWRDE